MQSFFIQGLAKSIFIFGSGEREARALLFFPFENTFRHTFPIQPRLYSFAVNFSCVFGAHCAGICYSSSSEAAIKVGYARSGSN